MKIVVTRVETTSSIDNHSVMPIGGSPTIVVQGENIDRSNIILSGENIPEINSAGDLAIYSKDFSGEYMEGVVSQKYSGTPYTTVSVKCVG